MIRLVVSLLVLASPASAWEFRATEVCELTHSEAAGDMRVTYDPARGIYAITVTKPDPWPPGPVFGIRFDGPRGSVISTGRHRLTADRRALTVTDTGFGNVLDGLQFNDTATAFLGGDGLTLSLDGAAAAVAAFRACPDAPGV